MLVAGSYAEEPGQEFYVYACYCVGAGEGDAVPSMFPVFDRRMNATTATTITTTTTTETISRIVVVDIGDVELDEDELDPDTDNIEPLFVPRLAFPKVRAILCELW